MAFTGTPAAEQCEATVLKHYRHRVTRIGQYNRRKISGTTIWSQHSWGNAIDIHVDSLADGDKIYEFLHRNREALGIRVLLWRVRHHHDHLHVDFWPRGIGTPPYESTGVGTFKYEDGSTVSAKIQLVPPQKVWEEAGEDDLLGFNIGLLGQASVKGDRSKALQNMLLDRGYALPQWGADGSAGDETRAALQSFQNDQGVGAEERGRIGPLTYAALFVPPQINLKHGHTATITLE